MEREVKVAELADQHGVSRQTIYNAIKAVRDGRVSPDAGDGELPAKRGRAKRITPATEKAVVEMKLKYPTWGVDYLRQEWLRAGNPPLSRASIYRILREAGVNTKQEVAKHKYERFEMKRPGQLYQMDIQGKLYLPNLGWVHGFSIIDDHSRYIPSYRYFPEAVPSNGILTLNQAIERHGVPEALYVDNGSQFRSRGQRMNNFELFCAAHGIKLVTSTPYHPEGKGKVERLHETVERQFIAWVRVRAEEDPHYTIAALNRDLEEWLETRYHARVHGTTKQTPRERFASGTLRPPDPPVEVTPYLERSVTRSVNKFGEVSYNGAKIQVDLHARARVAVVETIETVRVEYGGRLVREVARTDLSREVPVKRQDGISGDPSPGRGRPAGAKNTHQRHGNGPDAERYYHRTVSKSGTIKLKGVSYYFRQDARGRQVLVKIVGNQVFVYDEDKQLLGQIPVRAGRRY